MSKQQGAGQPVSPGLVWAWGFNGWGQLADGSTADRAVPRQVAALSDVVSVAAGADHSLAVTADGSVWTWGFNQNGQLGDGTTAPRAAPVRVSGELPPMAAVAAGYMHSLALAHDGAVWTWGCNIWGQLGDGGFANRTVPAPVMSGVTALAGGRGHSMALRHDRTVWTWGYNGQKQLGRGDHACYVSPHPVQVMEQPGVPLDRVVAIAAGASHSIAVREDGSVWEWGFSPANAQTPTEPKRVRGLDRVVTVAGGENHSLALDESGALWAWGVNWWGQMGDGATEPVWAPAHVPGLSRIVGIGSGCNHCLAVHEDGSLSAWGSNTHGAVGPSLPFTVASPVRVAGVGRVLLAAGGGDHSLVLLSPGSSERIVPAPGKSDGGRA